MTDIKARFDVGWPGFRLAVDLQLPGRGVTALFGPSGSGKTTVLRCLAGLERAPGGYLQFQGEVWQEGRYFLPTHKRPLGYVFQEASLFPHLSVLDNLRYGQRRSEASAAPLDRAVALLGIEPLLARRPLQLSGGERQRVAIARALAVNPRLLLMDEPLAALDLARKREILPYLERLHDELAIPIIYVSHSPEEVARLADTLVVLEAGQVRASGPLAEVLTRLDLPMALGEDVGTVVEGQVALIEPEWHLARVDFAGGGLWVADRALSVGQQVRLRVLARDVSLATAEPVNSSIQNHLRGRIEAIGDDPQPALVMVRVQVADRLLLARVTRRALAQLSLGVGDNVWLQVKSVALME